MLPASDWFHAAEAAHEAPAVPDRPAGDPRNGIFARATDQPHGGSDIFGWQPQGVSAPESSTFFAGLKRPSKAPDPVPPAGPGSAPKVVEATELFDAVEIDAGGPLGPTEDGSSIVDDLGGPVAAPDVDGSAVRLEDPGVERTLTDDAYPAADEPPAAADESHEAFDGDDLVIELLTEDAAPAEGGRSAFDLADADGGPAADSGGSVRPGSPPSSGAAGRPAWQTSPGSDLFASPRSGPPGGPGGADESGRVDPIDSSLLSDQPSLSSAPSSIFSADRDAGGTAGPGGSILSGGSADVRIDRHDDEQTVFGTDADDGEDNSHILGRSPFAAPPGGRAGGPAAIHGPGADDRVAWISPSDHESDIDFPMEDLADAAPDSGILSHSRPGGPPPGGFAGPGSGPPHRPVEHTPTELAGAIDLFADDPAPTRSRRPAAAEPMERSMSGSGSVEVNWADDADDSAPMRFAPSHHDMAPPPADIEVDDEDEPEERPRPRRTEKKAKTGGGMLLGELIGLAAGVAICAVVYFTGMLPTDETKGPVSDPALAEARTELDAQTEKAKAATADLAKANAAKIDAEKKLAVAANAARASQTQADELGRAVQKATARRWSWKLRRRRRRRPRWRRQLPRRWPSR